MANPTTWRWGAGLTVLATLLAGGCAVNPATGSRQLVLISESQEIAMGREYDQEVAASIGLYPDTALQRWIAATESGTLRGTAVFVEHGGAVYRLLGYAPEARWAAVQAVAEGALQSFARLTDSAALAVQPQRVDIVRLEQRTTIEELARKRPSPVPAATLALLKQVEPQTPLEPDRLVKWIVGPPLP